MGDPTNAERGLATSVIEDPAFLEWAKKQGKPVNRSTPYGALMELVAQYEHEQRDRERREAERALRRAKQEKLMPAGPALELFQARARQQAQAEEEYALRSRILGGWRTGSSSLKTAAENHVKNAVPITRWLYGGRSHGYDRDQDRWTYMRYYYLAYSITWGGGRLGEDELLDAVVGEEKRYLAVMKRYLAVMKQRADALDKARRPGLQLAALRAWAKKQPMNPADDFEAGVAYYDLAAAASKPDWIEHDLVDISQDDYVVTLSYRTGKPLRFPTKSIDFEGTYAGSIATLFARRHKASGRLIPFAIYEAEVDLYSDLPAIDELSSKDRVLMAVPRFDGSLTPQILSFYSTRSSYLQAARGLTKVTQYMILRRALPIGAPATAGALTTTAQLGARGFVLGRAAVAEVTFAVRTYGFTLQAASHLGRSAYTYYLVNAVAVNTNVVIGTEIVLSIAGSDMGPMNPGDMMTMAIQADDAIRAAPRAWKAVRAEVVEVDPASAKAVIRVSSVDSITDDVAKAEYDLGKKVSGQGKGATNTARGVDDRAIKAQNTTRRLGGADAKVKPPPPVKPAGKKGVKLSPDPRKVAPMNELEQAMQTVVKGLDKLGSKYNAKALEKIRNLSADAIRESGIRPSDLAKLASSLSRAGNVTRRFVNDFYDVPGFERVLLGWAKRHYWNLRLKKPAWIATKSFYSGTSYVMKYATAKLDPKLIRFEWPASINDTKWGEEVFARYVDIVVSGGSALKPGQQIQLELKSWTAFVLRQKATSARGGIGYQLIRDTALFRPENIRWIFDGKKVTKQQVIAAFEDVILNDPYLLAQWGGKAADPAEIRKLLDQVIEVWPPGRVF